MFADQTALSGVLWPLEDRTGAARDIISTAGVVLDHRKIDSFGKITSQTGPTVDYDQFFSGLSYDADSQLYYARARWYDPVGGKFIGEDPLRFGAGDTNLSRYSANDPINNSDPTGMMSLGSIGNFVKDVGHFFSDIAQGVGDFFEDNWENGNVQKGLLVAGTIVSGGALAFGGLAGMGLVAGGLGFASGLANSYEVFSGNQIGDGTFTRVLSAAAAVTGGFYGNLSTGSTPSIRSAGYWSLGRGASIAAGATAGYEIASGRTIGDGTLSGVFHVANLGVNQGGTLFTGTATQSFGVGINIAAGGASLVNTGDKGLQQALRSLSIATGVWNTGTKAVAAYQTSKATIEALRPTPIQVRAQSTIQQTAYQEGESGGGELYSVPPEQFKHSQPDAYLDAVTGNQPFGFTEEFLNPTIASFQSVLDMPIEYAPEVGYRTTGFFRQTEEVAQIRRFNIAKEQWWETQRNLSATHNASGRELMKAEAAYKADPNDNGQAFATASREFRFRQARLEEHTGQFKPLFRFEAPPERPMTDFEAGRTWLDNWLIDPVASTSTGYADAWTGGYTSTLQSHWYGEGLNAYNQDSYFYAGGNIAGTATFAYATGAGVTRVGAFAAGYAPTATYIVGAGATAYGGYQLYGHTSNTIENWDNLSGPQRVSAVGVPIAGLVGGYAGYRSVPAETIFQWQSAGASSRAYTNRLASSLWADEAGTIQTGYGAFGWEQRSVVQSTLRPNNQKGPANTVHVRTTQDQRAVQSTIFNQRGEAMGHIDWKDLEGHYFSTPGYPNSGHGAGKTHHKTGTSHLDREALGG